MINSSQNWYHISMHKKQVVVEAPLTKCKGRFVSYIQHLASHLSVYIVESYVASYRAARQLILQYNYLSSHSVLRM